MKQKCLVIPGGSGFLGRTLAAWFAARNWEVVVLSRDPDASVEGARVVGWDGRNLGEWTWELDGAMAIVNLAGRSVNCRYHRTNLRRITTSRVESTRVLGEAIARCGAPPTVWINSSTATIYRHHDGSFGAAAHDEDSARFEAHSEARDTFSIEVAQAWEAAFHQAYREHGLDWTRPLLIRSAMVFGAEPGGVWHTLRRLVKLGLGGTQGDGRQWVSWIHAADFCRAIEWLIETETERGVFNLAAPRPLRNREMMAILRDELDRPLGLPAPRPLLELGAWAMRTEPELVLKSRRVISKRLEEAGFEFRFAEFAAMVCDLEAADAPCPVRVSARPRPVVHDYGLDGLRAGWIRGTKPNQPDSDWV